jgi:flavodoxin
MKVLVAYFTATGVTGKVARKLAEVCGADLYDICPAVAYSTKDLDWTNKASRSSVEMEDKNFRPKLADRWAPVAGAEIIFLGYPVWWYREPSVIDSFLEAYDFTGKKIVPFVTSGGSGIGDEAPARMAEISKAEILPGKRFPAGVSHEELKLWADSVLGEDREK